MGGLLRGQEIWKRQGNGRSAGGGERQWQQIWQHGFIAAKRGWNYWILKTVLDKAVRRFKISTGRYHTGRRKGKKRCRKRPK